MDKKVLFVCNENQEPWLSRQLLIEQEVTHFRMIPGPNWKNDVLGYDLVIVSIAFAKEFYASSPKGLSLTCFLQDLQGVIGEEPRIVLHNGPPRVFSSFILRSEPPRGTHGHFEGPFTQEVWGDMLREFGWE